MWVEGSFKISFSNFQVYNTELLIVGNMLYINSPELIHLITESLYSLIDISLFSLSSQPRTWQLPFYSSYEYKFLDSTCKWAHTVFVVLRLDFFNFVFKLVQGWVPVQLKKQRNILLIWKGTASYLDMLVLKMMLPLPW